MNNNKKYFLLLALSLLFSIYQIVTFEYNQNNGTWNFIGQIWSILLFSFLFWSKKDFTKVGWFAQKKEPTYNTSYKIQAEISEEDYLNSLPEASELKKKAYIELSKLCSSNENQEKLIPLFKTLKNFDKDKEYPETLDYIIEFCDKNNLSFIMSLSRKQEVQDIEWRIETSLKENFGINIELPDYKTYPKHCTVSSLNIINDYDKPLRDIGYQMGLIDNDSPGFVFLIHKTENRNKIKTLFNTIGHKYYESENYA